MQTIVSEFHATCTERGVVPLVLLVDSPPREERPAESHCAALGVACVRTALPLAERAEREGVSPVFEHDDHWNAAGHRWVAELLEEPLARAAAEARRRRADQPPR
jgi:hypothetical protein